MTAAKPHNYVSIGERCNLVPGVFVPLDQWSENERFWEQPF